MLKTYDQLINFVKHFHQQMIFTSDKLFPIYIDFCNELSLLTIYQKNQLGEITSLTFQDYLEIQCRTTFFSQEISDHIFERNIRIISQLCSNDYFDSAIVLRCVLSLLKSFNLKRCEYIVKLFFYFGMEKLKILDQDSNSTIQKLMSKIFIKIDYLLKQSQPFSRYMSQLKFIAKCRQNNWKDIQSN